MSDPIREISQAFCLARMGTGWYCAMETERALYSPQYAVLQANMTYFEACREADKLNECAEVQES